MFKSFWPVCGSLLFALLFLLFLQLDWRGKTLETRLMLHIKQSTFVYFLQNKSNNIKIGTKEKISNLTKLIKQKTKKQASYRLDKISKSIKKTFKRTPSTTLKTFKDK